MQLQISVNPKRKTVYNTCGDYFVFVERYCSKETNLLQRKRNRYIGKGKPLPHPHPHPLPSPQKRPLSWAGKYLHNKNSSQESGTILFKTFPWKIYRNVNSGIRVEENRQGFASRKPYLNAFNFVTIEGHMADTT